MTPTSSGNGQAPLHLAPRPCATCPYRLDTPPGIWAREEYEKLAEFDDRADGDIPRIATFHCHQTHVTANDSVCRGWLAVHADSIAVRIAQLRGVVTPDQVEDAAERTEVALFPSGRAAADAGLAGIDDPTPEARAVIAKLSRYPSIRRSRQPADHESR